MIISKVKILVILILITPLCFKVGAQNPGIGYYMNKKSQQYDDGYNKLKADYDDLMGLELVNKTNKNILNAYKIKVKEWSTANFSKYDLSLPANVDMISKFFNEWYSIKSIQYEISLIRSV